MPESAPFNPFVYWPHVVFGVGSAVLVLIAIFSAKGSWLHRRSGQLFAIAMGIAALTAVAFSFVRPAPLALFSSVSVLYGIGAGILALRPRKRAWRASEYFLVGVPIILVIGVIGMTAFAATSAPEPVPPIGFVLAALLAAIFGYFAWSDIRYLRASTVTPFERFRRHALRMALAAAETVRAPLISFGPPVLGEATGALYFFGPFLLIPVIYFAAMPAWVRKGEMERLRQLETDRMRAEVTAKPA